MSENYYMKLEWEENTPLEIKVKALYNVMDFLSREMSIGRVPNNKRELENNLEITKNQLTTPLSIAFVKMVEKGEIDEITASENANMFIEWSENGSYNINDYRNYSGKLYKCLQTHTGQADWTPDVSPSLWKECGVADNGILEWSQPISSADAYMIGDEVMYEGVHYRSTIDNNVWSPVDYPQGWEVVEAPSGDEV